MIPWVKDILFSKEAFLGWLAALPITLAWAAQHPPVTTLDYLLLVGNLLTGGAVAKGISSAGAGK